MKAFGVMANLIAAGIWNESYRMTGKKRYYIPIVGHFILIVVMLFWC